MPYDWIRFADRRVTVPRRNTSLVWRSSTEKASEPALGRRMIVPCRPRTEEDRRAMALMEFHISREARSRYQVEQTLFSFVGNVVFGDLKSSRELAHRMNQVRRTEQDAERAIHPGALFAMGLIDEASHLLMHYYRKTVAPSAIAEGLQWFSARLGVQRVDDLLMRFVQEFPGTAVYRGEKTAEEWLARSTDGISHREAAFEELIMLWLANAN